MHCAVMLALYLLWCLGCCAIISQLILPPKVPASQHESTLAWAAYQTLDICGGLACMSVADATILCPAESVVVDSTIKFTTTSSCSLKLYVLHMTKNTKFSMCLVVYMGVVCVSRSGCEYSDFQYNFKHVLHHDC